MSSLEESMPDPDRRDAGLLRLAARVFAGRRISNGKYSQKLPDTEDKLTDEDVRRLLAGSEPAYRYTVTDLDGLDIRILSCFANGLGNRETADATGVSFEFVDHRLKKIKRLLAAKTRSHAVAEAIRQGLID